MEYKEIGAEIIRLKDDDLSLRDKLIQRRELGKGYNEEMRELHDRNARLLDNIMDSIGYPTVNKVGKEASEAAWLIIQHSIGQPEFMKKSLRLLENAVGDKDANPINLAYLTDRIAVFENKPQLYGTSFDWDENGELNPEYFDDVEKVNQRRESLGLNTLEEQTEVMRKQAKNENQLPPADYGDRKRLIAEWKRSVGWTK